MTQQFRFSEGTGELAMLARKPRKPQRGCSWLHPSKEQKWDNLNSHQKRRGELKHGTSWEAVQGVNAELPSLLWHFMFSVCTLHDLIRTNLLWVSEAQCIPLISATSFWGEYYYYPCFIDEHRETQRSWVTSPGLPSRPGIWTQAVWFPSKWDSSLC